MKYNRSTCKVHGVLEYIKYNLIRKGVDLIRKGVAASPGIGAEAAGRGLDEDWDYSPLAGLGLVWDWDWKSELMDRTETRVSK